eukprot:1614645-Rhodomonas_salina.1
MSLDTKAHVRSAYHEEERGGRLGQEEEQGLRQEEERQEWGERKGQEEERRGRQGEDVSPRGPWRQVWGWQRAGPARPRWQARLRVP